MPNTDEYIGVVISDVARLLRTEFDRRVRRLRRRDLSVCIGRDGDRRRRVVHRRGRRDAPGRAGGERDRPKYIPLLDSPNDPIAIVAVVVVFATSGWMMKMMLATRSG